MTLDESSSDARAAAAQVNPQRLLDAIQALASFGARDDGGVDRPALSGRDLQARRYLIERAIALGCTVTTDHCANLFIRRAGSEDLAPVMTGSHADTQPSGGKLDGCYGVLAGLECIEALNDAGIRTRRPLEVAVWTNEEGTRFQPGAMGSSAFVDPTLMDRYNTVADATGVTLAQALQQHAQTFPALARRNADQPANQPAHAFIELHIEQGPQLENANLPLGIVSGIQGVRWYSITCTGVAAHAGTTPMPVRRDAMTLAIDVRATIDTFAHTLGGDDTRVTFGRWSVAPNSINTIPSTVTFTVDFRHPDAAVLAAFDQQIAQCAQRDGVALQGLFSHAPVAFDNALLARLTEAAAALDTPTMTLTSGAFHDAMYLARHCPTAMLFVPSRDGISHNPLEHTDDDHLVLGTRALAHCLATLCNEP
ncbi:M20 family metallo-hydrolase [Paraburkholderia sp. Ac-20340]|uniref:M20 family metallo-hydrolase n=1 Tax=Paraburkholderia sp. Ac-20340 TaxID=2703888 RepID=UPI00197E470F|nr:M20 family metallo-hydrolase [Paraburkholderia sp. Ac-20340]MBN3856967.1 M20 family metallo-hydrolase [Paraburkholderia sp. Ac-20340]